MTEELLFSGGVIANSAAPITPVAFTVKDGFFNRVFQQEKDIEPYLKRNDCKVIDLAGRAIIPAQVDAHTIATFACRFMRSPSLVDIGDTLTMTTRLRKAAASHLDDHGFLFVTGWKEKNMALNTSFLDKIMPNCPTAVFNVSFHGALLNTAAIKKLVDDKILKSSDIPENGILQGEAYDTFVNTIRPTPIEFANHFLAYEKLLLSLGVATAHDMVIQKADEVEVLKTLAEKGYLKIRWRGYVTRPELLLNAPKDLENFKLLGTKLFIDGSYGMKNAWQDEAHAYGDGSMGEQKLNIKDIMDAGEKTIEHGANQLAAHCVGYRACELFLSAAEELRNGNNTRDIILRALHFETSDTTLISKANSLGVHISMQPSFSQDVKDYAKDVPIPEDINPMKEVSRILKDKFSIGSDSMPAGYLPNAELALEAPLETQIPTEEFIKLLPMMTSSPARLSGEQKKIGAIKSKFSADFVVLNAMPHSIKDIKQSRIIQTWAKGKLAFDSKE